MTVVDLIEITSTRLVLLTDEDRDRWIGHRGWHATVDVQFGVHRDGHVKAWDVDDVFTQKRALWNIPFRAAVHVRRHAKVYQDVPPSFNLRDGDVVEIWTYV